MRKLERLLSRAFSLTSSLIRIYWLDLFPVRFCAFTFIELRHYPHHSAFAQNDVYSKFVSVSIQNVFAKGQNAQKKALWKPHY